MRADQLRRIPIYLGLAALLAGCAAHKRDAGMGNAESVTNDGGDAAALQVALNERDAEIQTLKGQIDELQQHDADLTDQLKQALRNSPGKTISDHPEKAEGVAVTAATIKQLQDDLKSERDKRRSLEQQLAHLKAETTSPPLPETANVAPAKPLNPPPPPETANEEPAKQPSSLPPAPEPIAEAPAPPQEPPPAQPKAPPLHREPAPELTSSNADVDAQIAALKARSIEQETRQQEALASLAHVLDADRRQQEDLEAQIVALRTGAPGTDGAVASDSNEVNHLRTRLEEERHKNAELTAKLKLASRVTDLVYRMQNQANGSAAPSTRSQRQPQLSQEDEGPNSPHQPYENEEGNVNQPIAPSMPNAGNPRSVDGSGEPAVPKVEQPPVFPNGQVEETTQD